MGRRYYCDYCDKTFIDDLYGRRKHLNCTHHVKLRKLHYEQYRDPRDILAEESVKTACRKFIQTQECPFTFNCKYRHYTLEELWNIKQQIELEEYEKFQKSRQMPEVPSVESWIEKFKKKHNLAAEEVNVINTPWTYPDHLESRPDLPPSLKKFKAEDFKDEDFNEWGVY